VDYPDRKGGKGGVILRFNAPPMVNPTLGRLEKCKEHHIEGKIKKKGGQKISLEKK